MVQLGLIILRQTRLRSPCEQSACLWRSRSFSHVHHPKAGCDSFVTHITFIIFRVSPDTVSRIFRCPSPHFYSTDCWTQPGPVLTVLTSAASSTGLWEWSGCETQKDLNLYPPPPLVSFPESHDLTPPGGAFWPWTQRNFWPWQAGGRGGSFWIWHYHWWVGSRQKNKLLLIPLMKIQATMQQVSPESLRPWEWDLVLSLLQFVENLRSINDDQRMRSLV